MNQVTYSASFVESLQGLRSRHRPWFRAAIFYAVLTLCFAVLMQLDTRQFAGVSVWTKPFKFALSFVAFFGTLAWFAPLFGPDYFRKRPGTVLTVIVMVCAALELLYMSVQAALGEASHFNHSTSFHSFMYSMMGLGAVLMVGVCLWLGVTLLLRGGFRDPYRLAVALGLILTFVLGGGFGGYLSSGGSHWVGGIASDANALPLFHWSRSGGDLRVAHFFGMHAMQIVPLLALPVLRNQTGFGTAWVVTVACGLTAFTTVTLLQAIQGQPFFA